MNLVDLPESVPNDAHSAIAELASLESYKTDLNRHLKQLDGRRKYLEQFLLAESKRDQNTKDGIASNGLLAAVVREKVGIVNDWDALYEHIIDNRNFYLLKKDAISSRILEAYEEAYDWAVVISDNPAEENFKHRTIFIKDGIGGGEYKVCFDMLDENNTVTGSITLYTSEDYVLTPIDVIHELMSLGVIQSPPPGTDVFTREKIKLTKIK